MKRRNMGRVIWPSHCPSHWIDQTSLPSSGAWCLLLQIYCVYFSLWLLLLHSLHDFCHVVGIVPNIKGLASLYISSQENEGPHPSGLIDQQESPPVNGSPEMVWHHKAPPLKIHRGGEGYRGVEESRCSGLRKCVLPHLIWFNSCGVHVREQVFPPNHSSWSSPSVFNSVVFQISSPSILWFFKKHFCLRTFRFTEEL